MKLTCHAEDFFGSDVDVRLDGESRIDGVGQWLLECFEARMK
jgi:hypothetical protein